MNNVSAILGVASVGAFLSAVLTYRTGQRLKSEALGDENSFQSDKWILVMMCYGATVFLAEFGVFLLLDINPNPAVGFLAWWFGLIWQIALMACLGDGSSYYPAESTGAKRFDLLLCSMMRGFQISVLVVSVLSIPMSPLVMDQNGALAVSLAFVGCFNLGTAGIAAMTRGLQRADDQDGNVMGAICGAFFCAANVGNFYVLTMLFPNSHG